MTWQSGLAPTWPSPTSLWSMSTWSGFLQHLVATRSRMSRRTTMVVTYGNGSLWLLWPHLAPLWSLKIVESFWLQRMNPSSILVESWLCVPLWHWWWRRSSSATWKADEAVSLFWEKRWRERILLREWWVCGPLWSRLLKNSRLMPWHPMTDNVNTSGPRKWRSEGIVRPWMNWVPFEIAPRGYSNEHMKKRSFIATKNAQWDVPSFFEKVTTIGICTPGGTHLQTWSRPLTPRFLWLRELPVHTAHPIGWRRTFLAEMDCLLLLPLKITWMPPSGRMVYDSGFCFHPFSPVWISLHEFMCTRCISHPNLSWFEGGIFRSNCRCACDLKRSRSCYGVVNFVCHRFSSLVSTLVASHLNK